MTDEDFMELALALGLWLESLLSPAYERARNEEHTP
jgi:hypothetical protein